VRRERYRRARRPRAADADRLSSCSLGRRRSRSRRQSLILLVAGLLAAVLLAPGARAGRPAHISQAAPAVRGTVFADANANGARDPGEAGLPGWTVFVDLHGTGQPTPDDPSAATAADGSYSIAAVPAGTFLVRVVPRAGFSCTQLSGCLVMQAFPVAQTLVADFGEHDFRPPPPVLGRTFTSGVVSGQVFVRLPGSTRAAGKGSGFVALTQPRSLPVGTVLDTRTGTVAVTTALSNGGTQSGDFGAGVFKVLQDRRQRGLTQLNLMLSRSARLCPATGKVRTAAARLLPKSVLALLRANVQGKFRSRGRYSSGTVRGTSWDTVERCDGTLTSVHRGVVAVLDLRRRRTVLLSAGGSYLAR
jgi:hypothetical protein